jgi:hypothetical protein
MEHGDNAMGRGDLEDTVISVCKIIWVRITTFIRTIFIKTV